MGEYYSLSDIKIMALDYLAEKVAETGGTYDIEDFATVTLAVTDFVKYIDELVKPIPYSLIDMGDKND